MDTAQLLPNCLAGISAAANVARSFGQVPYRKSHGACGLLALAIQQTIATRTWNWRSATYCCLCRIVFQVALQKLAVRAKLLESAWPTVWLSLRAGKTSFGVSLLWFLAC